eukprot:3867838-Pleurochrysis_carterae.AAC.1
MRREDGKTPRQDAATQRARQSQSPARKIDRLRWPCIEMTKRDAKGRTTTCGAERRDVATKPGFCR